MFVLVRCNNSLHLSSDLINNFHSFYTQYVFDVERLLVMLLYPQLVRVRLPDLLCPMDGVKLMKPAALMVTAYHVTTCVTATTTALTAVTNLIVVCKIGKLVLSMVVDMYPKLSEYLIR